MKDLFGLAILDYVKNNTPENLITETNISEPDVMEISYLFREYKEMPKIEKKALELCKGKILDIGCGAGSHSLYLQKKGFDVTAMDQSSNAIEACKIRGIKQTVNTSLTNCKTEGYDTILLLMNGTGIFENLNKISGYLQKLYTLLNHGGQILIDSSDLIYMYDQDEQGAYIVPATNYYGELQFIVHYKNQTEKPFPWLYLDYNTLQNACHANQLKCELILQGKHYDYLARITKI